MDWVTSAKDIVVALCAIATAGCAIAGLNKWSTELRGRTAFDAARALLKAALRIRESVRVCRSPMITAAEFGTDHDPTSKDQNERYLAYAEVYSKRWAPVREAIVEFETSLLEAEVLWGKPIRELANPIRNHAHQLFVSLDSYLEQLRDDPRNRDADFVKFLRPIIHGAGDDYWFKAFEGDLERLECALAKHLGRGI